MLCGLGHDVLQQDRRHRRQLDYRRHRQVRLPTQAAACPALSNTYNLATFASTTFNAVPLTVLAAGASATYAVTVQLDSTAANTLTRD